MSYPFDTHPNGAYSTVATAPSPATSGTTLTVASGDGSKFASGANAVLRKVGNVLPIEIVRVTAIATDTLTITRAQESTSALSVDTTYEVYQGPTAKSLTDIEQFFQVALTARFYDEFFPGNTASQDIGQLGWASAGTVAMIASVAGHPGLYQVSTGAAFAAANLNSFGAILVPADTFDAAFIVMPSAADTSIQCAFSLADSVNFSASNQIGIRKAYADTVWQAFCRSGGSETAVSTGVSVSASAFARLRFRRADGSTIAFSVNGSTEVTITTNVPTAALRGLAYLINSSGAPVNVNYQIDTFWLAVTGLSR